MGSQREQGLLHMREKLPHPRASVIGLVDCTAPEAGRVGGERGARESPSGTFSAIDRNNLRNYAFDRPHQLDTSSLKGNNSSRSG